ncbi:hypothetical protein [Xenorhabdus bovienii]|uniref:hypothetical protein n=1 Tax=Xenorhabdus bovienii TaxID=40576 RepID=UPI0023B20F9C|nr:hypothetical protein [Xenorhabdus bovienii]MDE9538953.1 hypothetical protein [Xenorhabdus bovienii]
MSIAGNEIQNGNSSRFYSVVTTYIINGRQFMYGQSRSDNNWHFVQEILKSGKLDKMTESGTRDHYYDFVTVLEDTSSNKKYLYCTSTDDSVLSLYELTSDGKTKFKAKSAYLSGDSAAFAPYLTDGKLFVYKQDETGKFHWKITNIEYTPD